MTTLAPYYEEAYHAYRNYPLLSELLERIERESRGALQWVQEAKTRFAPELSLEGARVIEMGGGLGGLSILLAKLGAEVTLVDVSETALQVATQLANHAGVKIQTQCMNVGLPSAQLSGQYDLIIDSHLLHCLPTKPERFSYYQLVKDALAPQGLFIGETMVHRKKLFIPPGFRFDEDFILWQKLGDWLPVRKIADSLELEDEFNTTGLKIRFFYYYANYSFVPAEQFGDLPADILPASVRFVLRHSL